MQYKKFSHQKKKKKEEEEEEKEETNVIPGKSSILLQ
jgi:hypothetical protein